MLNLDLSEKIADAVLVAGQERRLSPLCVTVMDPGGHLIQLKRQDGASSYRPQIALGKAAGCIGLGVGGRTLAKMASERPNFVSSLSEIFPNGCVPVRGGVLIRNAKSEIIGAVGVTGDSSENDEACAIQAIQSVGLEADAG
ncbi:MAG: heme-binding protein [Pseudomonadota bacterium]